MPGTMASRKSGTHWHPSPSWLILSMLLLVSMPMPGHTATIISGHLVPSTIGHTLVKPLPQLICGDLTGQLQSQSQAPPPSGQEHWQEHGMLDPVGGIPDPDPVGGSGTGPDPDPVMGTGCSPDPDPVMGTGCSPEPDPVIGMGGSDPDPVIGIGGSDPDPVIVPGSDPDPVGASVPPAASQFETVHFPFLHMRSTVNPSSSTPPFPEHFLSHLAFPVHGSLGITVMSQVHFAFPSFTFTPENFTAWPRWMRRSPRIREVVVLMV